MALGLILSGCTTAVSPPTLPDATDTAELIAGALSSGDISHLPFTVASEEATKEYEIVTRGLNGAIPNVTVTDVSYDPDTQTATVRLNQTYSLVQTWQFPSLATLKYSGSDGWQVVWAPTIVQPALDGYTRLSMSRQTATRGEILSEDGVGIVRNRTVYKVGIDKATVSAEVAVESARMLAALLDIDADAYAKRVTNGGPRQFVVAITVREGFVPEGVEDIPGSLVQTGKLPLGPSTTFAIGVLGIAGEATAEDIERSGGVLREGDIVGKTGLQASQDAALRGTDGFTIYLAPRAEEDVMAPPPAPTTEEDDPPASPITERVPLFQAAPIDGVEVQTTLDVGLQTKAEKALAGQKGVAALVVLDAQTGAIRAAANSPGAGSNAFATTGRYAPGSTFKVSTALAMLRAGKTPDSRIDCPFSVTIGGTRFTNHSGYSFNGSITLRQAVAYSCNTAMVNGTQRLGGDALTNAAASLGIGVGYDLGFPAYLGSVPVTTTGVEKAAASFGQAQIAVSPLAMAAEAASVAAGRTIVPYLLVDASGEPHISLPEGVEAAEPLTEKEAAALRDLMKAVVNVGTGSSLQGLAKGAKTGTAEFTDDGQMKTHAWMIAYTDSFAIAAYVHEGVSGSASAGPLIQAFLK